MKNSFSWIIVMAWRDARTQWSKYLLFILSITIGIAALFSIRMFNDAIEQSVESEAKTLLGADIQIESRSPFPDTLGTLLSKVEADISDEVRFASMVINPKSGISRLVQVRAFVGNFPYYGEEIIHPNQRLSELDNNESYVDEQLGVLLGLQLGDSLKVGTRLYAVQGFIEKIPGESAATAFVGPRVYIPKADVENTGLLQKGSRVTYIKLMYLSDRSLSPDTLAAQWEEVFSTYRMDTDTVDERKRGVGRALSNLYRFLNLIGFVALILGAIGVGSSMQVFARQKKETIALLRCLGVSSSTGVAIFAVQAFILGIVGTVIGILISVFFLPVFPALFQDFLPVQLTFSWSWTGLAYGLIIGVLFSSLFSLWPLVSLRLVNPLQVLRTVSPTTSGWKDPLQWLISLSILFSIVGFTYLQIRSWESTFQFILGLIIAFSLIGLFAFGLMKASRAWFPSSFPYVWRQGIANLFRPNNQTLLIALSIGLGTFLVMTQYLTQTGLLSELKVAGKENQPNMILFDIQYDQKAEAEQLIRDYNMPILSNEPVVTMRLSAIGSQKVSDILEDTSRTAERWALRREYRSTYRDSLASTEKLLEGEFVASASLDDPFVPITLETGLAKDLDVSVGDTLVFDVQGIPISTKVSGIREVDWQQVRSNFFVVFPSGVLEAAPQFNILVTKYPNDSTATALKREMVSALPNISIIDLKQILETADDILSRITLAIRFMALFSVLTGLIVLISSLISSRFQRIKESVLLRTLGASTRQTQRIQLAEFLAIGCISALTGILLSVGASYLISTFAFKISYTWNFGAMAFSFAFIVGLTVTIGWLNTRGLLNRPPLETLRMNG